MHRRNQIYIYIYKLMVEKPERKKPIETPQCRLENDTKMDVRKIGLEDVDWTHLTWDRDWCWALVNKAINLWDP
jgi:hypothetical protein